MGEVWTAQHLALRIPIALKVIRAHLLEDDITIARFLREARSTAKLQNHHVVKVLDHGSHDGVVYIAMELMHGLTLRNAIQLSRKRLPYADITRLFRHIETGTASAHRLGIVHRDLKPGNLFINIDDDEWHLKVMDFGLAKPSDTHVDDSVELQTRQGVLLGTPAFMSPERLRYGSTTVQSDLWSLAIIAYELVCGMRPYVADDRFALLFKIATELPPVPSENASEIPVGFDEWFAKACHSEPTQRFPSATELIQTLIGILSAAPERREAVSIASRIKAYDDNQNIPTMNLKRYLEEDAQPTQVDLSPVGKATETSSPQHRNSEQPADPRANLTPIEVAELQTQIQYRLIEQLNEARETNQQLKKALESQDIDPAEENSD